LEVKKSELVQPDTKKMQRAVRIRERIFDFEEFIAKLPCDCQEYFTDEDAII